MYDISRVWACTELLGKSQCKRRLSDTAGPCNEKASWSREAHAVGPNVAQQRRCIELTVRKSVLELLGIPTNATFFFFVQREVRVKKIVNREDSALNVRDCKLGGSVYAARVQ